MLNGVPDNHIGLILDHKPKTITGVYIRPSIEVLRQGMERGFDLMLAQGTGRILQ